MNRPPAFLLLAILLFGCASTAHGADEIAMYLDEDFTVNCLQDLTEFPRHLKAYLVVHDCSAKGGLSGWECTLTTRGAVRLSAEEFAGAASIAGAGGDFRITLADPLPEAPEILLAVFALHAEGPGAVYVKAYGDGPFGNPVLPSCREAGDPGRVIDLRYRFGSPDQPVLTLGAVGCPVDTLPPVTYATLPRGWEVVDLAAEEIDEEWCAVTSGGEDGTRRAAELDWARWGLADICVEGVVRETAIRSCRNGRSREGSLTIRLGVARQFWGPAVADLVVTCIDYDIPGYIRYVDAALPPDLRPGDRVYLACSHNHGALTTRPGMIVEAERVPPELADPPAWAPGLDLFGSLRAEADLIVRGRLIEATPDDDQPPRPGRYSALAVESVLMGELDDDVILLDATAAACLAKYRKLGDEEFILYLQDSPAEFHMTVKRGCFAVTETGLRGGSGIIHPYQAATP